MSDLFTHCHQKIYMFSEHFQWYAKQPPDVSVLWGAILTLLNLSQIVLISSCYSNRILNENIFPTIEFTLIVCMFKLLDQTPFPWSNIITQIKAKAFFDLHNLLWVTCNPFTKEEDIFSSYVTHFTESLPNRSLQSAGHFNK